MDRTSYLEWQARALSGIELFGVTVLSRNEKGEIAPVGIHHRPLNGALKFFRGARQSLA